MAQVIWGAEGRYDAKEVEFGKVYRWRPENIVIECDCGQKPTFTRSRTTCDECGADHAVLIREWLESTPLKEDKRHPWHYASYSEETGLPF